MKKRILTLLLVVLMMVGYAVPFASAEGTGNTVMKTFYVSPNGNDNNDGTSASAPFKTLEQAKNAVDAVNDNMTGDIVVYLMDGTWELEDTLSFGERDSGTNGYYVRYEAAPGANPVISGGTKLNGTWTDEDNDGIYSISLDRDSKLRALYINGERRYMAHTENAISAQGSWGTYTVGGEEQSAEDFTWETVYTENFEGSDVSVGQEGNAIQKYDKGNNLDNCVINVAATGENNKALQIAHTANGDSGFEIPNVTYRNAMITYRVQFASDHVFTLPYEALHMHGANKLVDENGRTTWAGVKLVSDANEHYFQSGTSGGNGDDDATTQINQTSFTFNKSTWYQVKMMVTDDGQYLTKIWVDGETEPENWTRSDTFTNLNEQDKFLRIYAYKGSGNSKMNILVDDIVIQSGTKIATEETTLPDWAWTTGTKFDGIQYSKSNLPEITRNITDVEIENQQTWNKNTVCVREIVAEGDNWILKLQQPYGAIAQTPGWGVGLQGTGNHMIYNAYELLDQPGEFYFDRAVQTLYYKPYENENLDTAQVVIPRVETLVEFKGSPVVSGDLSTAGEKTITGQVKNIIFDGITIAHSDWNLQKVGESYGKSTVQAGTVYTAFASGNWHADMYRNLDTIPGAVEMEFAHNIRILNGEIKLTGAEGVLLSNDVDGCEVTGNYIYQTGGGGVVVGNPQHIYENDSLEPDTYYYKYVSGDGKPEVSADGAAASHEKYQGGTERVPRDVTVSNNLLVENCRLFPSHCPITSFFTQNLVVRNNFIKDAAYSGMSIGWGWCNFDGEINGDRWGTENNQGYAILPNIPTNTCFGNQIVNNRIDTVMTVLHDGGLIYTLGKQENTQISDNFVINSQNHGIYQDEGSACFKPIENNVIANVPSSGWSQAIYTPAYGRKHDLHYKNNYSNVNTTTVTARDCTCEDFYYIADAAWPKEASDIIQNSGLTAEYRTKFAQHLTAAYGSVQDALLPADAHLSADESLTLNAWLSADDEIWLAPAGTTEFAEGETMTKTAGNATEMQVPKTSGKYYLYVKPAEGDVSSASTAFVRVEAGVGLGKLEAEDCSLIGGYPRVYTDSVASGGKGVENLYYVGNGITLGKLTSAVSQLTIHYASMASGTFGVYVNNEKVQDVAIVSNGAWNGSYTTATVTFEQVLQPGDTLALKVNGDGQCWNIDYFELSYSGAEETCGDVDNNGEINALDAAMVYAIANGKTEATEAQLEAADVNGDGEVTPMDAALIYAYANGKITQFSASVND